MVMATYLEIRFQENETTIFKTTATLGCIITEPPITMALRQAMHKFNAYAKPEQKKNWTSVSIPAEGKNIPRQDVEKILPPKV